MDGVEPHTGLGRDRLQRAELLRQHETARQDSDKWPVIELGALRKGGLCQERKSDKEKGDHTHA
ncbi:hypothetical protein ACFOLL_11840 [Falsochrobactrum ovis]|uniref:hypothetical protein n=1 Tax=Falsochrobactrum ovis TaxID=1293442 RepID=UPI003615FA92